MSIRFATAALAEQHRARLMAEAQRHRVVRAARQSRSDPTELAKTIHRPWLLRWLGQGLTPAVVTDATVSADSERQPDPTPPAGGGSRRPRTQREAMPLIASKRIEGVFDTSEKQSMIDRVSDAMVSIEGEAMRP